MGGERLHRHESSPTRDLINPSPISTDSRLSVQATVDISLKVALELAEAHRIGVEGIIVAFYAK
jgi:hypothetical protein